MNVGLADSKLRARLADLGGTPFPGTPADFGKVIADETEKWGKRASSKRLDSRLRSSQERQRRRRRKRARRRPFPARRSNRPNRIVASIFADEEWPEPRTRRLNLHECGSDHITERITLTRSGMIKF